MNGWGGEREATKEGDMVAQQDEGGVNKSGIVWRRVEEGGGG